MPDYDNTNRGALFREESKQSDSHPDYSGTLNVAGTEYWLSGWIKTSKAGKKFLSLSCKPKEAKREAMKPGKQEAADNEVPF